jgi:hypothetical protein
VQLKTDERFIADTEMGNRAEEKVAQQMRGLGFLARRLDKKVRPTIEQRHAFADQGDVVIQVCGDDWVCETKWRPDLGEHGECEYADLIVSNAYRVDMGHLADWYYIVNKDLTGCWVFPKSSRSKWLKKQIYSRPDRQRKWVYTCPVSEGTWWQFGEEHGFNGGANDTG